jgi:diguanylate cyclase (GGDEF)-like protein
MVRLLPMLFALFFIVQSTACYSTALFEDKALEFDLTGHMEFAVADSDTLVGDELWVDGGSEINREPHQYLHFRVTIENALNEPVPLWFSIAFPSIEHLYVSDGTLTWITGDALPFSSRAVLVPNYHFPFILPAQDKMQIYGHMEGKILRYNFFVATPEKVNKMYVDSLQRDMTFFGAMSTLTILSLVVFTITRKMAFLSFAAFIFATSFWFFRVFGYAFEILWPTIPQLNDITYAASIYAVLLTAGWTVFSSLKRPNRTVYGLRFAIFCGLILPVLGLLVWHYVGLDEALRLPVILLFPFVIFASFVIYKEHNSGSDRAKWLAVTVFPVVLSTLSLVLIALFGIELQLDPITMFMVGVLITCMFMVILASRLFVKIVQKERDTEKANAVLKSEQASKLEALIQERTKALSASNEMLKKLAANDGLTNLPNRRSIDLFVDASFSSEADNHHHIAVALIDLDHFKNINDTFGHEAGDTVLIEIAKILQPLNSKECMAGRFGGEEFAIIQQNVSEQHFSDTLADIHKQINTLSLQQLSGLKIGACIGWTVCKDAADIVYAFRRADKALYKAKDAGRNRIIAEEPR